MPDTFEESMTLLGSTLSRIARIGLLGFGIISGPINAIVAMSMGEDQRAIAISVLSLVAIHAAGHFKSSGG